MRYVIGQRPSARSSNPFRAALGKRVAARAVNPRVANAFSDLRPLFPYPAPQFRAGVRPVSRNSVCHMGTNGQWICTATTKLRTEGGAPQPFHPFVPWVPRPQKFTGTTCPCGSYTGLYMCMPCPWDEV
jgi:hypothetical protein